MNGAEVVQIFEIPCGGFVNSHFNEPLSATLSFDQGHTTGPWKVHRHHGLSRYRVSRLLGHQKDGERPHGGAEVIEYSLENIDTDTDHTKVEMGYHVPATGKMIWGLPFFGFYRRFAVEALECDASHDTRMSSKLVSSHGFHDCATFGAVQCTRPNQPCLN